MTYTKDDVRAQLSQPTDEPGPEAGSGAAADYMRFYNESPAETASGARTWYARGQNFVVCYTEFSGEYRFERHDQADEYAILLPDASCSGELVVDGAIHGLAGDSLTFVPPGSSRLTINGEGRLIVFVSHLAADLTSKASNASSYDLPRPNVAPLEPWPEPPGGFKVRSYALDVPGLDNPPFRLFRCSTFMVNYVHPTIGPRDPATMSPHWHKDFEQCSLILDGQYVHHIRWPWSTDLRDWRADEHELCAAPSVTIIPPPAIHTSQASGSGRNHLVDVFAPPRVDFSAMEGWVLNAEDYPLLPS